MSRSKNDQGAPPFETKKNLEEISRILGDFNMVMSMHEQSGGPLPPVPIHGDKSEFDILAYYSDFKGLPEGSKTSSAKGIVHTIATAEHSYLADSAASFISKYWRSLWPNSRSASSTLINELCYANVAFSRETLYRLLLKIQKDSVGDMAKPEASDMDDFLPQVARDIEAANLCAPPNASSCPPFMKVILPQVSEHIVCALALEYLVLRMEENSMLRLDSLGIPMINKQTLERIIMVIDHRNIYPDITSEERDYNRLIIQKMKSWMELCPPI